MATTIRRNASNLYDQELAINNLEAYLQNTLGPVRPRQAFVQGLRGKLETASFHQANNMKPIQVKAVHQWGARSILLFLAGLAASLVLLITGIKATLSIVEAIKSIRQRSAQPGSNNEHSRSASLIKSTSPGN